MSWSPWKPWDAGEISGEPPPVRGICAYLGDQTGFRDCALCGGSKTKIKVFACNHPAHIETTWTECQTCPHYASLHTQSSLPPASPDS